MIEHIRKRDGRLVPFEPERIREAVRAAQRAVGEDDAEAAGRVVREVTAALEAAGGQGPPDVEQVQDLVERALIEAGRAEAAKAYILHRQRRAESREAKRLLGVEDDLKLGLNAVRILEQRYLLRDEAGRVSESPRGMFERVARVVAEGEAGFGGRAAVDEHAARFFSMMHALEFLPNSPTLMNAGTRLGQLSACFVLPVPDSIDGIFSALHHMAVIHQSGGGTGFSFSRLRPRGDPVRTAGGHASGPVSFMRVFDAATEVVRQGGRRRGANMGILRIDHPDVQEFVTAKADPGALRNFNLSVAVTDAFMKASERGERFQFRHPETGEPAAEVAARDLFDLMATTAWQGGEPGLVFIDRINAANPLPGIGPIESTNPCGEQPLLPYESCNLGSINLARMLDGDRVDRERLGRTVEEAVRFLDDVIEVQSYPLEEIEEVTRAHRKIGLGVMGFADMLIGMGIPYASDRALEVAGEVMGFITERARRASAALASERGPFACFEGSRWRREGTPPLRNATVTTVAPTGSIAIIAGVSSGIEPLFAPSYFRRVLEGQRMLEEHPLLVEELGRRGLYSRELMTRIARAGSLQPVDGVPDDLKQLFACAMDIEPAWHVRMQAAFQAHTDNAVSKTVNLPHTAGQDQVRRVFSQAHRLGCKGITVYRYGSRRDQTLSYGAACSDGECNGPLEPEAGESTGCRRCEP